jgi:outer membrane protein assembly factor BamB
LDPIVLVKWVNWRTGLVIGAIAIWAMAQISGFDTPEVHNSNSAFNFVLVDPRPSVDDWPWWQGTDHRNVANTKNFPTEWSSSDHHGWNVRIPGYGNASPCLWGNQLFLPVLDNDDQRLALLCLERDTGRIAWRTILHQGRFSRLIDKSLDLSSPACDGKNVFTVSSDQGKLWITAVEMTGRIAWQRDVGPYQSHEVYQSSPVLFKSLIIVSADQPHGSFLAAVHRQTGEIIWRIKRPNGTSFGTPIVATISDRPQLVIGGAGGVTSYDPTNGQLIWKCAISAERVANTIAFDQDHVFLSCMRPNPEIVCIDASGHGDVTKSHICWRLTKIGSNRPSPICHDGWLYVLADDGRLSCVQPATGKIEWTRRLEGQFTAAPVIAGPFLLCANEAGITYFVRTGGANTPVTPNALPEGIVATPIIVGDSIFFRTTGRLHRVVAMNPQPVVERPSETRRRY